MVYINFFYIITVFFLWKEQPFHRQPACDSSGSAGMVMMAVTDNHRIDLGYAKGPEAQVRQPVPLPHSVRLIPCIDKNVLPVRHNKKATVALPYIKEIRCKRYF